MSFVNVSLRNIGGRRILKRRSVRTMNRLRLYKEEEKVKNDCGREE